MRSFTRLTTLALAAIASFSSAYYFEPRDHEHHHPSQHQYSRRALAARYAEALPKPYILSDDDYGSAYLSARDASSQYNNYDYDIVYRRLVEDVLADIKQKRGGPPLPPINTQQTGMFGGPMVGSPTGSPGAGSPMQMSPDAMSPPPPGGAAAGQGKKRPADDDAQSSDPKRLNTGVGHYGGAFTDSPGSSPVSSPGSSPVGSPNSISPPSSPGSASPGSVSPMTPPKSPSPPPTPQRQDSVYNAQIPSGNKVTPDVRNQGDVNRQNLADARSGKPTTKLGQYGGDLGQFARVTPQGARLPARYRRR